MKRMRAWIADIVSRLRRFLRGGRRELVEGRGTSEAAAGLVDSSAISSLAIKESESEEPNEMRIEDLECVPSGPPNVEATASASSRAPHSKSDTSEVLEDEGVTSTTADDLVRPGHAREPVDREPGSVVPDSPPSRPEAHVRETEVRDVPASASPVEFDDFEVPESSHEPGRPIPEWITGENGALERAVAEVASDYQDVDLLQRHHVEAEDFGGAKRMKSRKVTIAGEDVIGFLSRKAVIPKYGFPVDVVELDLQRTDRASTVALQRDLAIAVAEFAPDAEVVANKKLWTSRGLKTVAGKAWGRLRYRKCKTHGIFETLPEGQEPRGPSCCNQARTETWVDPIFGFVAGRDGGGEPQGRPRRLLTSRPYFSGMAVPDEAPAILGGIAQVWKASPGDLVVLCEGRKGGGFLICADCGAGFGGRRTTSEHESPTGRACRGTLESVALGHQFRTDMLRVISFESRRTLAPRIASGSTTHSHMRSSTARRRCLRYRARISASRFALRGWIPMRSSCTTPFQAAPAWSHDSKSRRRSVRCSRPPASASPIAAAAPPTRAATLASVTTGISSPTRGSSAGQPHSSWRKCWRRGSRALPTPGCVRRSRIATRPCRTMRST